MGKLYPSSLKGQFLTAMPNMNDPNFARSVTCICEHTPSGAVGLVINRRHPIVTGKDIFDELKIKSSLQIEKIPVYIGGPVHIGEIFILHGPPFGWEGCLKITPHLAMSNTKDILESIARGKGPEDYLINIGCAGWGEGQLESEIKQNVWLTCPIDEEILFNTPDDAKWENTMKVMGIDPLLLSDAPGHA